MSMKLGDKVKLKSGGPIMTIEMIKNNVVIICQWFDGPKVECGTFNIATLEIYKD